MTVLADVPGPDIVVTPEMDPATKLVTGCPGTKVTMTVAGFERLAGTVEVPGTAPNVVV